MTINLPTIAELSVAIFGYVCLAGLLAIIVGGLWLTTREGES